MPARPAGRAFSPLDEALGLVPGSLSPRLLEAAARQGSKLPFAEAAEEVAFFWGVRLSAETLRRQAEGAGAALTAIEDEAIARLEQEFPAPPQGPAVQQVSVDGAMVHLVGGEWAEVKTAVIGTVETRPGPAGESGAHAADLTCCSRLADAATFGRRFKLEAHRRGTQTAGVVVAVQDGAEWIQGLLDTYCRDAVRVLDFAHLVEHLAGAARATYGADTPELRAWVTAAAHTLKHHGPDEILPALRELPVTVAGDRSAAAALRDDALAYLGARLPQAQYPLFRARGYPIGSGMRWARRNVCPLLALRAVRASGRWDQAWPAICQRLRQQDRERRQARRQRRHPQDDASPAQPPTRPKSRPILSCARARLRQTAPPKIIDGKPTPDHPWKVGLTKAG